ncbi:methylenetetrahydrofolate reductase [NAD(P)H] [Petroclostridium sp. X23]|uniref:methylenetetrahydrofolate reductase [NAD(P)H] n=1 Tax=Petroclostridium sp. X23 TaxID=3045146 RepID=UPI0024AC9079|nr:methylenetetrahydrofolate reductase [NAD(P)H] [Petroclostridium sp. X23]WHH61638.1 methylenetetrahydrofolate reductase [NAD(P)H] [Petroclostridium sp. X23]
MHIARLFKNKKPVVSFEIFPPKPDYPVETIFSTLDRLKDLKPDFISVTYGAGGSNRERTEVISSKVKNNYGIECLSHLTCVCTSRSDMNEILEHLRKNNIENILALRGDVPKGYDEKEAFKEYRYALDLIRHIKEEGDFCIAAAAYPEGHIQSDSLQTDIKFLKQKVDEGVDFLITQLFFDNRLFYNFWEMVREEGINIPITIGIMPVLNANQIKRITTLCGSSIPTELAHLLSKYCNNADDLEKAGIEYASKQTQDLLEHGVDGIHFYTMNKPEQIYQIMKNCNLTNR